jgi:hypothetical protein
MKRSAFTGYSSNGGTATLVPPYGTDQYKQCWVGNNYPYELFI